MKKFTDAEIIQRVYDVYLIKNVMARHAYYHAYDMHEEEIDEIWVSEPENKKTASFGQNWGYQVGLELIRENYAVKNDLNRMKDLRALRTKHPEIEYESANRATGSMLMHCLTTPYIEVAGDGETAQGMWYSPGQITFTKQDGVDAMYMFELYGADFIKEGGQWKLWHLFIGTDFMHLPGVDMKTVPVDTPKFDLNDEDEATNMVLTYEFEAYTSRYNWHHYPAIPKPYGTFSEAVSNGPEGNPNFGKEA